jgi:hypothetical protein
MPPQEEKRTESIRAFPSVRTSKPIFYGHGIGREFQATAPDDARLDSAGWLPYGLSASRVA